VPPGAGRDNIRKKPMSVSDGMTKEWLENEIIKLGQELAGARSRLTDAVYALGRAQAEYESVKGTVETLEGCIQGLRAELVFVSKEEA
jgi:predicted  nucleic acid-binding Zn-ribbon protein